ncbi:MAG: GTP cyclohydrolase I FolE [Candidatus Dormibacteraeota bacterium]|uniref:GTP cyclohydrolase 1 n=1 Tax=Candidatus Aeolococcus gillhamiae TaxID=3127015 RepID=A0A2W5ZBK1_9BACT|nr:GTP cyclohydrolase I FolE [Candidatus Dormibacteraeota bacterium]PZR82802.1 MAG: GTP cyclohydrolase I FolE [Candidatus Dormibacter sp. RRmetagenome_bin12]
MDEPTPLPIRPSRDQPVAAVASVGADPIIPLIECLIREVGEDTAREGLLHTPDRVARSLRFLLSGYDLEVADVINGAVFEESYEEMVLVRDIEVYSLCEHHLLPFFGKAHVAYLPRGRIVGLSKLPRIVEMFARRLQVQERLTTQIAAALNEALDPYGVAVVIEASHLCMMMRGVEKQNSRTVTSALTGGFQTDPKCRNEFLDLLGRT